MSNSDWFIVRDAEKLGNVVSMTSIVESVRTEKNDTFRIYFRESFPKYLGIFDDDDKCDNVLSNINRYIVENDIDMYLLDFPLTSGSEVFLLPITDNLKLKILIVDEYFGYGEYEKYIDCSYFLINDNTTILDVDNLIDFVKEYLN